MLTNLKIVKYIGFVIGITGLTNQLKRFTYLYSEGEREPRQVDVQSV